MKASSRPILVLGGGINGAAIARELVLNGMAVCVVDSSDVAGGATSASSRLIHGGLRYLEYGQYGLVRESLAERTRLLRLAPHLVRPLRLYIPVERRTGGLLKAAARATGISRCGGASRSRGLWVVRLGMWLYDRYAADSTLPRRSVHRVGDADVPRVDPDTFRWLCAYHDAQIHYPERLVIALLDDARRLAQEQGLWFRVLTYRNAMLQGRTAVIHAEPDANSSRPARRGEPELTFEPLAVVNATGAWVDRTLKRLQIDSPRLLGPTKGSHFISFHQPLREARGSGGVYAEAPDGRPVFLLPFGGGTLVGTTDLPFEADPGTAVASDEELDYLVSAARRVFPHVGLARRHIDMHYSGVRPLAAATNASPAAASRDHRIKRHSCAVPLFSVVGGKLTTARLVAEQTAAAVLESLHAKPERDSRDRVLPGGNSYPAEEAQRAAQQEQLSERSGVPLAQVQAVWRLCGTEAESLLASGKAHDDGDERDVSDQRDRGGAVSSDHSGRPPFPFPVPFVRHVLRREWVQHLSDLVERRLMLLYDQSLSERTLRDLARLMVEEQLIDAARVEDEVSACRERLRTRHGKQVQPSRGA